MNLKILNTVDLGEGYSEYYECEDETLNFLISNELLTELVLLNGIEYIKTGNKLGSSTSSINYLELFIKTQPNYINKIIKANKYSFFNCDSIFFFYNKEYNIYIYYKHLPLLDYIPIKELQEESIRVEYIFKNDKHINKIFNVVSINSIIHKYDILNHNILEDIKKIYNEEPYINIFINDYKSYINNFKNNIRNIKL